MNLAATSCVPGIAWPAIPTAAAARLLALQWQLDQSQWWLPERLREHQLRQLRLLAAHAIAHVPHYREALAETGIASPDELDEASFRRWPILKKAQIRARELQLRATRLPHSHGGVWESETTGSTGTPTRVLRTDLDALFAQALIVREHLLHGRNLGLKLGTIRAGVERGMSGGWGVTSLALETGPGCGISLYEPLEAQLEWLLSERPAYLLATPLNLRELVQLSRRRGVAPEGLLQVMTFAAMLPGDLRALVRDAWGVDIADTYSCGEAGTLAVQCPAYEHYLVQAENVYLEVIRDDGTPCTPGETGRVIITPLHSFAMPLIRYELGDYAEAGGRCPTGRGLPTLNRIAGRVRNLLRDPTGRLASPNIPPGIWLDTPIEQFRLVQHTLEAIEVQYISHRVLSADEGQRLVDALCEHLGYRFDIRLSRVEKIERQKGDKYEEVVSFVAEGRA